MSDDTEIGKRPSTLTPRQQRFVQEYVVDLSGTQAAIRAGYSKKTANEQASRLLADVNITDALEPLLADRAAKVGVKAEMVLFGIAQIATANMADYITIQSDGTAFVDLSTATREQLAAVQEITTETYTEGKGDAAREVKRVKLKLSPKLQALESLGKHLGMYIERKVLALGHFGDATDGQLDSIITQLAAEIGVGPGAAGKETETRH